MSNQWIKVSARTVPTTATGAACAAFNKKYVHAEHAIRSLTEMRRELAAKTDARVLLGGSNIRISMRS
jgi:hypothetical protein